MDTAFSAFTEDRRPVWLKVLTCAVVLVGACAPSAASAAAAGRDPERPLELLSIAGLPVGEGQYVSGFEVATWDVRLVAICKLTPGWDIGGGTDGSAGGALHGQAAVGLAFLAEPSPAALHDVFLVRVQGPQRPAGASGGAQPPPTFAGTVDVGRYGPRFGQHKVRLRARNFILRPARGCPGAG